MITNSLGFHGAQAGLFHALGLLLIVTERTLSSIWYNFWLQWRINNLRLEWSIKVNFLNIIKGMTFGYSILQMYANSQLNKKIV